MAVLLPLVADDENEEVGQDPKVAVAPEAAAVSAAADGSSVSAAEPELHSARATQFLHSTQGFQST